MSAPDNSLSLFLVLDELPSTKKCYAEFTLRVKNQLSTLRNRMVNGSKWFMEYDYWGLSHFMSLQDLKDPTKGYYVNDTVIVECQISFISVSEVLDE